MTKQNTKIHKAGTKKERTGGAKKTGEIAGFDFGLGKLNLGSIFQGIGKIADLVERAEKAGGELKEEGTISGSHNGKDVRGFWGLRVKTGIGKGGSIKKTEK